MAFKAELLRAQSTLQAGRLKTNSSALSPTFDMTLFCQIWLMAFFQILFIFSMIEYSFYRNTRGNLNFGKFKRDRIHYLWEEKLASFMVKDQLDCAFLCDGESKCYSFNMAAYPDSRSNYPFLP